MASFTLQAVQTGLIDSNRPNTPISSEATAQMQPPLYIYFGFGSVPSAYQYKDIKSAKLTLWYKSGYLESYDRIGALQGRIEPACAAWDPATLTWRNAPGIGSVKPDRFTGLAHDRNGETVSTTIWPSNRYGASSASGNLPILDAILNGVRVETTGDTASVYEGAKIATHLDASCKPTLEVEYGADAKLEPANLFPTSRYVPKNQNCTFKWGAKQNGNCLGAITLTGCVFRWRVTGAGTYTEVDCGTGTSYMLPGTSITADSIQWQVEITDSQGNVSTSDWITLSTVEAASSAETISPKNTMVDGSVDTVFRWAHIIRTGTAPTASELQISTDGSTWTALATVSGSDTETTIPAGTLTSGSLLWRVRTYNTDNAAGSWSDEASVLVVAAPGAPAVSAEQTPRPLISWQSSGQQGYQIRIPDAWESGSVYGTGTSRKLPVILPDGDYVVEVRVANEYGLWSDWGSAPLTVENVPGDDITLAAFAALGAIQLTWTTSGSYERYAVERDGVLIAVTSEENYTDLRAVGEHVYRVFGLMAGTDNYTVSSPASVELTVEVNSITDLLTGEILELPYSTTQIREERISYNRSVTVTHFAGAAYPSAEIGEGRDKIISFEAAFFNLAQARRLEALVGRLVCLKAKNGESVTGVLPALDKTSSAFWVDYTGELTQIDENEEVEL